MKKMLIICGPTAVGKTALGVQFARKYSGEIISADSRQIYKGMDIITGKDLPVNSKLRIQNSELEIKSKKFSVGYRSKDGIPIWLIDVVNPDYTFNVGDYLKLANKVINNILLRGKLPIIVGGTGLYIKALTSSLPYIHIPPNLTLRNKLNRLKREELTEILKKINLKKWCQMNVSDKLNPRRLVRAIEVVLFLKKKNLNTAMYLSEPLDYIFICLTAPRDTLYKRIDKRVDQRVKEGAIEETKQLMKKYHWNLPALSATGYKQLRAAIENSESLANAIQKWKYAEHGLARRQLTWFKKEKRIIWFDISEKNYVERIEKMVTQWYTE